MGISSLRNSNLYGGISEGFVDVTISTNVATLSFPTSNIGYIATAPTANFTLNVTSVPTTDLQTITVTLFVVMGATGYICNALQIDGSAQTIKWVNGLTPTATSSAGKIDIYSFTLLRRSAAWQVFGSAMSNF